MTFYQSYCFNIFFVYFSWNIYILLYVSKAHNMFNTFWCLKPSIRIYLTPIWYLWTVFVIHLEALFKFGRQIRFENCENNHSKGIFMLLVEFTSSSLTPLERSHMPSDLCHLVVLIKNQSHSYDIHLSFVCICLCTVECSMSTQANTAPTFT